MGTIYATRVNLTSLGVRSAAVAMIPGPDQDLALQAASGMIDSYLGSRFKLPLATYGADLTMRCCELAAWIAIRARGFNPESSDAASLRQGYDDAIAWLKDVARGLATPAFPDTTDKNSENPSWGPFTVQPAQGGIGVGSAAMQSDSGQATTSVGSPITPRSRGW